MRASRLFALICCISLMAMAPSAIHGQDRENVDSEQDVPPAFMEATQLGFVLHGYRDTDGLKRVIEHYLGELRIGSSVIERAVADAIGLDVRAVRDMQSMIHGANMGIHRIEFVPGLTGRAESDPSPNMMGRASTLKTDGLTPGFPSRGSLVATKPPRYTTHHSSHGERHDVESVTYPDKSSWTRITIYTPDGGVYFHERTTGADGTIQYEETIIMDGEGNATEHVQREHQGGGTEGRAEAERRQAAKDEDRGEQGDGGDEDGEGDGDDGGDEGEDNGEAGEDNGGEGNEGEEDVDEFQPAGGSGRGTFCPLVVEQCRRALEQTAESQQDILVGMVRVNPGEPRDERRGPRLVFDPEDLVINPDPERVGKAVVQFDSRRFRMELPVLVNPPGPNER